MNPQEAALRRSWPDGYERIGTTPREDKAWAALLSDNVVPQTPPQHSRDLARLRKTILNHIEHGPYHNAETMRQGKFFYHDPYKTDSDRGIAILQATARTAVSIVDQILFVRRKGSRDNLTLFEIIISAVAAVVAAAAALRG